MSSPALQRPRAPRYVVEATTRGLGVVACAIAAIVTGNLRSTAWQVLALIALAIIVSIPFPRAWMRYAAFLGEGFFAALIVVIAPAGMRPSLVYLVVPPIVAGFSIGIIGVLASVSTIAIVLSVGILLTNNTALPVTVVETSVWLAVSVTLGMATLLVRHLQDRLAPPDSGYQTARVLLSSLRDVARTLPEGLEEPVLAQRALQEVGAILPHDRAGVFVFSPSGALVEVAREPANSPGWNVRADRDIWTQSADLNAPVQRLGRLDGLEIGSGNACAVIPLRLDGRHIGAIAIERSGGLWAISELNAAQTAADAAALRLDAARIFDDVRELATMAERQRLSREIHDGIAQQVAGLGMIVEDIVARTNDPATAQELARVRGDLSTMVTELRLSIFDLRSDSGQGIGTDLADYVRREADRSQVTAHLHIEEQPTSLKPGISAQLLRIAQEAVTNALRHAQPQNVWVTYRADELGIVLEVADDGVGIASEALRADSFGLMIMRERATSIHGELNVTARLEGGTIVQLALESQDPS